MCNLIELDGHFSDSADGRYLGRISKTS